jgi:hypothetical protein
LLRGEIILDLDIHANVISVWFQCAKGKGTYCIIDDIAKNGRCNQQSKFELEEINDNINSIPSNV